MQSLSWNDLEFQLLEYAEQQTMDSPQLPEIPGFPRVQVIECIRLLRDGRLVNGVDATTKDSGSCWYIAGLTRAGLVELMGRREARKRGIWAFIKRNKKAVWAFVLTVLAGTITTALATVIK